MKPAAEYTYLLYRHLLLVPALCLMALAASAQQKQVLQERQYWLAYMTSARLAENYSFWNDIHFVGDAFLVARTGITRHLPNRIDLTAGYAHGWLGVQQGDEIKLKRQEHRPWAQVVPYAVAANEVLVNFGQEVVTNTLDQNRLSLMVGGRYQNMQVQAGYMQRYVPSPSVPGRFTQNHTLVVWVFHTFDLRKKNLEPEKTPEALP